VTYLLLPEHLKPKLRNPLGQLIIGPPSEVNVKLKELITAERPARVILVGDTISRNMVQSDIRSDVLIIDKREMRQRSADYIFGPREVFKATNPAGKITAEAWRQVEKAILAGGSMVEVEGEEDLLTLVAILSAPLGSFVAYGQPGEGIVLVRVTAEKQREIRDLVDMMEQVD